MYKPVANYIVLIDRGCINLIASLIIIVTTSICESINQMVIILLCTADLYYPVTMKSGFNVFVIGALSRMSTHARGCQ